MRILISGPQGSGKTTQARLLSKALGLPLFSTGEFLRRLSGIKSETGRIVKHHLETGTLIPDDLILELVSKELSKPKFKKGFVIEGNPRTLKQAEAFKPQLDLVIELQLDDDECLKRLINRKRMDDTEELIKNRLKVYHRQTEPMFEYYKKLGILKHVNGAAPVELVHKQIMEVVTDLKNASH